MDSKAWEWQKVVPVLFAIGKNRKISFLDSLNVQTFALRTDQRDGSNKDSIIINYKSRKGESPFPAYQEQHISIRAFCIRAVIFISACITIAM
ncbi:hypothetical protein CLV42_11159 [Chitinophaga ginsengisoli]|uniref:Uncharacterized protein n=1 Tax=Chitinophaga ginsengisoli TaxID=363837 RepID=A0A2P8FX99_9BACT|nr:hypothetical protein CLV42_11159 [Chitinophaga ginsengisoli]